VSNVGVARPEAAPVLVMGVSQVPTQTAMALRRRTIEHVFGTLKHWMDSTHFLMRGVQHVSTEMSVRAVARLCYRPGTCSARDIEIAVSMFRAIPQWIKASTA